MAFEQSRCMLWIGDKHAGKTTAATQLVNTLRQQGYAAGGILAPSIYQEGQLIGFDIVDVQNDWRIPLAVRYEQKEDVGPYRFCEDGLKLGHSALGLDENQFSDVIIVDEFGPYELEGQGWRSDVDRLFEKSDRPVLLIVRRELADAVNELYGDHGCLMVEALEPSSTETVLTWLKKNGTDHK